MVAVGYTTSDLKAIPAASKVSGYSKLAKRNNGSFATPGSPGFYTWFDDENASADLGDLILRPNDGIGFYVVEGDRTYYAASDPPSLPLTSGTMAALGYFEWINTATGITWRYLGGSGFAATYTGYTELTGTALSGGFVTGYPPTYAFDDNYDTEENQNVWVSSQSGSSVSGNAWIGMDFGSTKTVTRVELIQYGFTGVVDSDRNIVAANLQSSSNGSTWSTVRLCRLNRAPGFINAYDVSISTRYLRLLAAANTTNFGWIISNLRFYGY